MLRHSDPEAAARLLKEAQADVLTNWKLYEARAAQPAPPAAPKPDTTKEPVKETQNA